MMVNKKDIVIIGLFFFLSIFVFRNYFFKNQVPFPANLLVAFYQPWASYQWEGYPNGPPNKPMGFDNLRIFYPIRKLTIDQFNHLEWPLWNPYVFSGNTLLASYQSAVFHPLGFLFLFLPQIDAWSIIIILQPILASIFMFLFLRELSLNRKASMFGAITFAFSGFMIVWMEESFMSVYSSLFLPLILYAIEKIIKKISMGSFIIILFGLVSSVLSGWFQMTFYTWGFAILWSIYRYIKSNTRKKAPFVLISFSYLLSLMISSIHLLPGIEAYLYSARGTTDAKFIFDTYLQPIYYLVTFIAPDFFGNPAAYNYFGSHGFYHEKVIYVGIPALMFALYQLINFKKETYQEKFFKWSWILFLSLGLALPTSWIILYYLKLPFISTIVPSRIFFLATFSISVMSAYGLEHYLRKPDKKKLATICFGVGLAFLLTWGFTSFSKMNNSFSQFGTISFKNLILPSALFLTTVMFLWIGIKRTLRIKAYIAILAIFLFGSIYFSNKYLYFSDRRFVFPPTPVLSELKNVAGINRVLSFGDGYIDKNLLSYYGLFSPEGYDSFYISRYGELLNAAQNNGKFSSQIPRADATIPFAETYGEILSNKYRKKLLDLLGVRNIVASNTVKGKTMNDGKEISDFSQVWSDDKFSIYEYEKSLPRAFFVNDYSVLTDNQEILDKVFSEETDLSKSVILEEEPTDLLKIKEGQGVVTVSSYTPNKITLNTQTKSNMLLFLSDNYYPGWKAFSDPSTSSGQVELKIYRANYSFRAVVVPEGNHTVIFQYQPSSFYAGLFITVLGLLLSLLFCIKIKKIRSY